MYIYVVYSIHCDGTVDSNSEEQKQYLKDTFHTSPLLGIVCDVMELETTWISIPGRQDR